MEFGLTQREIELAFWMAGMCFLFFIPMRMEVSATVTCLLTSREQTLFVSTALKVSAVTNHQYAGWSLCGHEQMELPPDDSIQQDGSMNAGGAPTAASPEGLSIRERVTVGLQCKRLIEYGRLKWVERQKACIVSEVVPYVDSSVSGENRLIVVKF